MEAVTYSNARQNMARLMDEVIDNQEAKIITRRNSDSVVMISLNEYNSLTESNYLLSNPVNAGILRQAREDLRDGKGIKRTLVRG